MQSVEGHSASKERRVAAQAGRAGPQFVGRSQAYHALADTIMMVAGRECPIVIVGETGTGKEVIARQIYEQSNRSSEPFVPVDCASLTGTLFESQLFGHVRGAFTGAVSDTLGFFRAASGGTLFLDEIGELDTRLQAKLLRTLQESCVVPVGGTSPSQVDVRVISATNRDLRQMVEEGTFRPDLYFRLNVFQISVPPLRERKEDISVLAEHFLEGLCHLYGERPKQLSGRTQRLLLDYTWPGNVRELANVVEYAFVKSRGGNVDLRRLPPNVLSPTKLPEGGRQVRSLADAQKEAVLDALEASSWRKMIAAKMLGISYGRLVRLMDTHTIEARAQ